MNLAYRDVRHNLFRFLLTCLGLSLLMAVVLSMIGIYNGLVVEALTIARAPKIDLWVVESGTRGPFAEASRVPGDVREIVARVPGVAAAGSITLRTAEMAAPGRIIRAQVMGYEPGRPGGPSRIDAGRGHVAVASDVGGHHGRPRGHRLEQDDAERLAAQGGRAEHRGTS